MKGLEGVSDSDFHGWTVPRYGADAKESGGAGVANLAVRGPRNRYMRGRKNLGFRGVWEKYGTYTGFFVFYTYGP